MLETLCFLGLLYLSAPLPGLLIICGAGSSRPHFAAVGGLFVFEFDKGRTQKEDLLGEMNITNYTQSTQWLW
jgi:hypothetical protein